MMKKQACFRVLHRPVYFTVVGFEALLFCIGTILCGLWFCSALLYELDLLTKCLSVLMGIAMVIVGVVLSRFFLPNLIARITVSDDAVTWRFLFRKISIKLTDIRYTNITNYKHSAIVPYIVLATRHIGEVPLNKLKRSREVIYFQLYEENVPILHEAIPVPYRQVLNKYLYLMKKRKN